MPFAAFIVFVEKYPNYKPNTANYKPDFAFF